jgi:hypothetical protein
MGLISKNTNKDFNSSIKKNTVNNDELLLFIKGGSIIVDDKWIVIKDIQLNINQLIKNYVEKTSRRLFNNFNDILYILIVLNKEKQIEIIPSISYNKKSYGEIRVFENLSKKIPLVLVKLQQDGSSNLSSYKTITYNDIEIYQGYGNFTLQGNKGETGFQGDTGFIGIIGYPGYIGYQGCTGYQGYTGLPGEVIQGITGCQGAEGVMIPAFLIERD